MTTPMRTCPHCNSARMVDKFQSYKGNPIGWCRSCRTEKERQRRRSKGIRPRRLTKIVAGEKQCAGCGQLKSLIYFYPSRRGRGNVSAYCKVCYKERYYDRAKARERTAAYRVRHSERWKALHRLHMHKRRSLMTALNDGSVTDDVLRRLYAQRICSYCGKPTEKRLRTIDHIMPLVRGGRHTAGNLTMACFACNSSKSGRHPEEFLRSTR